MRQEELNDIVDEVLSKARKVLQDKNPAYSGGGGDALGNFRAIAEAVQTSPLKAWASYYIKHHLSIMAYVRRGDESEPIEERVVDLINYLLFFVALNREERRRK